MGARVVGYRGAHNRVVRERGPASDRMCAVQSCDRWASDWAWAHEGPSATTDSGRQYGLNPDDYLPLCRSHHIMFDNGGLTHCPRGHNRAEYGVKASGQCKGCAADYERQRRARKKGTS